MHVPMAIIIIVIKNNNNERQWRDAALFTWFQVCFRKPLPPSLFLRSEVTQTRVVSWSRQPEYGTYQPTPIPLSLVHLVNVCIGGTVDYANAPAMYDGHRGGI